MDSQQEEEKFVVKWGKEVLANSSSASTSKKGEELKNVKQYASFLLEGTRFRLGDTVYLQASDGPPYIGKILSMYEGKKKGMHVRWFCRPSELPEGLPDVDYSEDNKEIVMCSGAAGAKNVVDPVINLSPSLSLSHSLKWSHVISEEGMSGDDEESDTDEGAKSRKASGMVPTKKASTIKKCSVVCTAEEDWNTTPPSNEQVAACDHVLRRVFDINTNKVSSLKSIVRQFGEKYVTGARGQSHRASTSNAQESKEDAAVPAKDYAPSARDRGPQPLQVREASPLPPVDFNRNATAEPLTSPSVAPNSSPPAPQHANHKNALPRATGERTSVPAGHRDRDGLKPSRSRQLESEQAMKGLPRGKPPSAGLPEAMTKLSSEHGLPDSGKKGPIWSLDAAVLEIQKRRLAENQEQVNKRPKLNGAADVFRYTASTGDDEPYVPRKKFFNDPPWEQLVERAVEKGQALHLQNLDPYFSSWEIEEMLQQLLRVHCDVRMLPPKDFSSYTSGEALVVFEACSIAEDAFLKLTENILIWSKDERPVVATIARKQTHSVNPFYGFLDLDKFSLRNSYRQQKKNATSHCSQPNTVEYEMGIHWRLLKDRHTATWKIAEQVTSSNHAQLFYI